MVITGILVPFFGTAIGAAAVFLMKKEISPRVEKLLLGFAAGVMVAASVWSLLIPAIELAPRPQWCIPAAGFVLGIGFLLLSEALEAKVRGKGHGTERTRSGKRMLIFAVTLHNIPEGMAVGVSLAAAIAAGTKAAFAAALALAVGIAIQNFPEGAIISMPLVGEGYKKGKAFLYGVLSGAVEPIGAALTLLISAAVVKILPLTLSFAAGAMFYVSVNELIPASREQAKLNCGVLGFSAGFLVMMILDVALG